MEKRPELRIVRQDLTLDNLAQWIAFGLYVFIFFELPLLGFLLGFGKWHGPAPIAIVSDVRRPWRTIRSLVERLRKGY
jgi:hypothetical protein